MILDAKQSAMESATQKEVPKPRIHTLEEEPFHPCGELECIFHTPASLFSASSHVSRLDVLTQHDSFLLQDQPSAATTASSFHLPLLSPENTLMLWYESATKWVSDPPYSSN